MRGIELEPGAEISHEVFVARIVGVVAVAAAVAVLASIDRANAGGKLQIGVAG